MYYQSLAARKIYNNHIAFFFSRKILRPLDNRPLGAKMYTDAWLSSAIHADPTSPNKQQQANLPPNKQLCPHGARQLPPHCTQETATQHSPPLRTKEPTTPPMQQPLQLGMQETPTQQAPPHFVRRSQLHLLCNSPYNLVRRRPLQLLPNRPPTSYEGANYTSYQTAPPPPSTWHPNNPPLGTEGNTPEVNQQPPLHPPLPNNNWT